MARQVSSYCLAFRSMPDICTASMESAQPATPARRRTPRDEKNLVPISDEKHKSALSPNVRRRPEKDPPGRARNATGARRSLSSRFELVADRKGRQTPLSRYHSDSVALSHRRGTARILDRSSSMFSLERYMFARTSSSMSCHYCAKRRASASTSSAERSVHLRCSTRMLCTLY